MPSARVPRPGSNSHVGISWERGEKDGASGLQGMGWGRGSIKVLIQRVQGSAWDRGSHDQPEPLQCAARCMGECGMEFWAEAPAWAKAQGSECRVYLMWPQRG